MESLRHTSISVRSGKLDLEGVVTSPAFIKDTAPGVVVCHPHPLYGGDMDNPVVAAISHSLALSGIVSLRFNFRGVGGSQGSFDSGKGEARDLEAAMNFLVHWPGVDKGKIGAAGYSFGAMVLMSVLPSCAKARSFAIVSPPSGAMDHPLKFKVKSPTLFVVGEDDTQVRTHTIRERVAGLKGDVRFHLVPRANHFWRGREGEVAAIVSQFFIDTLT
jgi:alpha/beta superfamily hydrolase